MNCFNCGEMNREQAIFCRRCGSKLDGTTVATLNRKKKGKEYQNEIAKGDKYFQEMDYVNAEATYLELITINPKKEEAYIQLADVYVAQDKYDEAIQILTQGAEQTKSPNIEEKLKTLTQESELEGRKKRYQEFLVNNLIPMYGVAVLEELIFSYKFMSSETVESGANRLEVKDGIRSVAYVDLTGDGIEEMVVIRTSKNTVNESSPVKGMISVQVYELQEEIVELEMGIRKMNYPIYQDLKTGNLHIFTKKIEGVTYLGVSMNILKLDALEQGEKVYTEFYTAKEGKVICTKAIMIDGSEVLDITSCAENMDNPGRNQGEGTVIKSVTPEEENADGTGILIAAYAEELCKYIGENAWYEAVYAKFLDGDGGSLSLPRDTIFYRNRISYRRRDDKESKTTWRTSRVAMDCNKGRLLKKG